MSARLVRDARESLHSTVACGSVMSLAFPTGQHSEHAKLAANLAEVRPSHSREVRYASEPRALRPRACSRGWRRSSPTGVGPWEPLHRPCCVRHLPDTRGTRGPAEAHSFGRLYSRQRSPRLRAAAAACHRGCASRARPRPAPVRTDGRALWTARRKTRRVLACAAPPAQAEPPTAMGAAALPEPTTAVGPASLMTACSPVVPPASSVPRPRPAARRLASRIAA